MWQVSDHAGAQSSRAARRLVGLHDESDSAEPLSVAEAFSHGRSSLLRCSTNNLAILDCPAMGVDDERDDEAAAGSAVAVSPL
jgi:hypothetical protein